MKNHLLAVVLIFAISCSTPAPEEETTKEIGSYTISQFMNNEAVSGGRFSPDKSKILITSNKSGIYNMYTISVNGGEYTPISESDSASIQAVSYFPNDERIIFMMDGNGDELFHIYLKNLDGSVQDLTPEEGTRALFYGWKHDLSGFYYGHNKRDKRMMDVYLMDLETLTSSLLYEIEPGFQLNGISRNGEKLALAFAINTNDSDLYIYDIASKEKVKINSKQSSNSAADFSPDGAALYYITDVDTEFGKLMKYDFASGESTLVAQKEWDITSYSFTYSGQYSLMYVNADAKTELIVTNTSTNEVVDFPKFDSGDITGVTFSRDDDMASFYVSSTQSPSNLYTYNMGTGESVKITNTLNPEIDAEDLVEAKVVRFNSFDGLEIPAIYYEPKMATEDNKVPALVWVHGGPGGQSRQNFSSVVQYFVNHGYAILAVNNRGSSGYGKTFYMSDNKRHGEEDLKDCIAGKDWLAAQSVIDGERIGILGGSYGGFMVMAALTRAPEEFDVGVNLFGVTNWIRTLKNIPPWWEAFKEALYSEMGDPNTADSVRLYEISPVFHADKITKPTMILQGANDPRVLQVESDDMVAAIKENNIPVEYVLFDDEGHGFSKQDNQIEGYGKVLEFLDLYLKDQQGQPVDKKDM